MAINQDGLEIGQPVTFEQMQRIESARRRKQQEREQRPLQPTAQSGEGKESPVRRRKKPTDSVSKAAETEA